jgi:hypothetical protein
MDSVAGKPHAILLRPAMEKPSPPKAPYEHEHKLGQSREVAIRRSIRADCGLEWSPWGLAWSTK